MITIFFFKLKNSEVFYERVGIKALNQTVFVDHLTCIYVYRVTDDKPLTLYLAYFFFEKYYVIR
jgi:hypothetical protein